MGLLLPCNNPSIYDVDGVVVVIVGVDDDDDKNDIDIVQTKQEKEATTHLMRGEAATTCVYCCCSQSFFASPIANVEKAHFIILTWCNVYLYNILFSTKWRLVYMILMYAPGLHIMAYYNRY